MSLNQFKENECVLTTQKHCPCIAFILGERDRHGLHASQLLHYRLEPNDAAAKDAAPEKLTIALRRRTCRSPAGAWTASPMTSATANPAHPIAALATLQHASSARLHRYSQACQPT